MIPDSITRRERDVLHELCKGLTNKEVAKVLEMSPRTVEDHRSNLIKKFGVRNMFEVALIRYDIITEPVE